EKHFILPRLVAVTTSQDGKIGVRPVFSYQLSFRPKFGVAFFDRRSLGKHSSLDATVTTGGIDYWIARVTATFPVAPRHYLTLSSGFDRRDDLLFAGIYPDTPFHTRSRYGEDAADLSAVLRYRIHPSLRVRVGGALGIRHFFNGAN